MRQVSTYASSLARQRRIHDERGHSVSRHAHLAPGLISSLSDTVDKKVLVVLRDGRKMIGVLRSYDQYGALG